MSTFEAQLPPHYELVESTGDDLHHHALELAAAGAEEGTLVHKPWNRANSNLDCALILQPEVDRERYHELAFVAAVSIGQAIAATASPMVTLQYGWPDRIVINDQLIGRVTLATILDKSDKPALVVGVEVYIGSPPKDTTEATSLRIVDSENPATAVELTSLFGRHFLHWINTWDEEGLPKVLAAYRPRIDRVYGAQTTIAISATDPQVHLRGIIESVDEHGTLLVTTPDETATSAFPDIYFGLGSESTE